MDEEGSGVSVSDVERIADELVHDFEGTCLLIANELASSSDPALLLDILRQIGRQQGDGESDEEESSSARRWLPEDLFDRFESDFLPQVVQLVLGKAFDRECVKPANAFLQFILERVKSKLLVGDPCLLPSLIRILDEQRPFYVYHGTSKDEGEEEEEVAVYGLEKQQFVVGERSSYVSRYFLRNLQFWGEIGGFSLFLSSLRSISSDNEENEVDTILSFEAIQCIFRTLYAVKEHLSGRFLLQYFLPFCEAARFFVGTVASAEFNGLSRESLLETVQVMELVLIRVLQIQQQVQRGRGEKGEYREVEGEADAESTVGSTENADTLEQSVQLLRLEIFLRQFRSSSLEKRIYGLTEIIALVTHQFNEQVQEQHDPTPATLMDKLSYLVHWMREKRLIEDLFGEKLHMELIKRSVPLFQFTSELECLSPQWLDIVWNCYSGSDSIAQQANQLPIQQRHEAQRTTVQDVLVELVEFVDEPLLRHLFRHLQSVRVVDASHLALLTAIGVRTTVCEASDLSAACGGGARLRDRVVMHLWTVVISGIDSEELVGQTLQRLDDIIRRDLSEYANEGSGNLSSASHPGKPHELVDVLMRSCIDNVCQRHQSVISLKFFAQLAQIVSDLTVQLPCLRIPDRKPLVDVIVDELVDYKTELCASIQTDRNISSSEWLDYVGAKRDMTELEIHAAEHLNEVKVRLLALRAAWFLEAQQGDCIESSPSLSRTQLDLVWRLLIKEAFTTDEAALCFQWIEFCMNTSTPLPDDRSTRDSSLLSTQLVEHLLLNKFNTLSGNRITLSTLCCFQSLFRHVNLQKGGLESFAASRVGAGSGCSPVNSDDIVDLATDQPLVGLEQLWYLAISSTNPTVAEECITLLASFYLEFVPALSGTDIPLQRKLEFVETCMGFLNSAKVNVDRQRLPCTDGSSSDDTLAQNTSIVDRCVDLLRYFLDACDTATVESSTSTCYVACDESGSARLKELHGISGHSSVERMLKRKGFELENLEERLQYLEIYPSPMKDSPSISVGGFGTPEAALLNASRRPSWAFRQQHALLDVIPDEDEHDGTEEYDGRSKFATEEFPVSPRENPLLLKQSGTPSKSSMKSPTVRVRPNLQWPQDVSPQRGPDLTIEDLSRALQDVSNDCEDQSSDQVVQNPEQIVASFPLKASARPKYSIMSQILANEGTYFDTLLQLVDWSDATSQRTWELICRLPTNNEQLRKMIRLRPSAVGSTEDVVWMDLLNATNVHRLLYALRLVEALLLPPESSFGISIDRNSDSARRQWRERFVRLGGAKHLYDAFLQWESVHPGVWTSGTAGTSPLSTYTKNLTATCLAAVIRTLNYFVQLYQTQAFVQAENASPFDVRLTTSTLPSFIGSINLKSLAQSSVWFTYMSSSSVCEEPGNPPTSNTAISVQMEEAVQCGVQLFSAISTLKPELLVIVFGESDGEDCQANKARCSISLCTWMKSVLLDCPSLVARTTALQSLRELTTNGSTCKSKSLFIEHLVRTLSELLLDPVTQRDQEQLFTLLNSLLSSSVRKWEGLTKQSVLQWLSANNVAQRLVRRLYEYVSLDSMYTHGSVDESIICGYLQILVSFALLSDDQREALLRYCPDSVQEPDSANASQWMVDFLLKSLLFGGAASASSADGERSFAILPKCKSRDSRDLAQNLLFALATPRQDATTASPSQSGISAITYILECHDSFQKSVLENLNARGRPWNFSPKEMLQDTENGIYYAGLVNPGCICYMNALLQQLFMTPSFRDGLLSVDCMSDAADSSPWVDEVAQLQRLFVSLASTDFKSFDPTMFALSHQDLDGNPTDLRVQMDADEFFCLLLDRIDTSLRRAPLESEECSNDAQEPATFLEKCFGGVLVNQIITQQGHVSEREERFFALSLEVSKKQHLKDSLSLYVQGESLDGENAYFCERLQQKVSATKRICIKKLPQTLVCHLKRFEFDFDTMEKLKINDYLEFPEEIDMFPYTSEALTLLQDGSHHEVAHNDKSEGEGSTMYDLVGIVVHSGTSDMGHYYSFIKDRHHPQRWLEFNDELVREFQIETMGEECFGGEEVKQEWDSGSRASTVQMKRRNAYMLIYERRSDAIALSTKEEAKYPVARAVKPSLPTTSDSLRALIIETSQANAQFQEIVNAFDPHYAQFIDTLVNQVLDLPLEAKNECERTSTIFGDWDGDIATLSSRLTRLRACALGSQYLFGMATLQPVSLADQSTLQVQSRLVKRVLNWLSSEEPETGDDATEQLIFSSWLLRQSILPPSSGQSLLSVSSQGIRTWLFDLLFLNESNPELVDDCISIVSTSLSILTQQVVSVCGGSDDKLEQNDLGPAVLVDFYRALLDLFYDRDEEIELTDSTTGGVFTLSSSTVVNGLTRIGSLLENCVCHKFATGSKERELTHQVFADTLQYIDRFLFTLQVEPAKKNPADPEAVSSIAWSDAPSSTSSEVLGIDRVRSCTFEMERNIVTELLAVQPSDEDYPQHNPLREHHRVSLDLKLLMNQVALTNILRFSFDDVLTPVLVQTVHRGTSSQREKLLSLLIAVLEDVKTTHLEKLLRVFDSLLDYEESETQSAQESSAFEHAPIHEHLFSPSRGVLEAAGYYKDHRVLHEYTFLLLEFTVSRAKDSPLLQYLFKYDEDIHEQASWITNWLISYLDPSGTIRQQQTSVPDEDAESDDVQLAEEVKSIFAAIEKAFGCAVFPSDTSLGSQSDSLSSLKAQEENSSRLRNQDDEGEQNVVDPEEIVTEFVESQDPMVKTSLKSTCGLILKEQWPEVEDGETSEPEHTHADRKEYQAVPSYSMKHAHNVSSFEMHDEMHNNPREG